MKEIQLLILIKTRYELYAYMNWFGEPSAVLQCDNWQIINQNVILTTCLYIHDYNSHQPVLSMIKNSK